MNQLTAITFDYGALDADTANSLRRQAERIRAQVKTTTCTIIEIGRDILAVKQHLKHGQFSKWVEAECGFTVRSAQNYMRAAEFAEGKHETVSLLEPAAVYKLVAKSTPPAVVAAAISRIESGEALNEASIKEMMGHARYEAREAALKADQERRDSKLPKGTLEARRAKQAEETRLFTERRESDKRAAIAAARAIVDRIGLDAARFLSETLEANDMWNVLEELQIELQRRKDETDDGMPRLVTMDDINARRAAEDAEAGGETLILRHDHNAEELGLVEPEPITPNAIINSVANDPAVRAATGMWDRTAPSTHRDLVRARDEAQARMGILEADRAYLYSTEVESYLLPITMRMARGDEAATIQRLRREFRVLYGDYAERVLTFCLRNYQHANGEGLRRAAEAA